MRPLWAVHRVVIRLHPTQGRRSPAASSGEILGLSIPGCPPLSSLVARIAETDQAASAGRGIHNVDTAVWMVRIA